jgi:hypothetical protein
MQVVFLGRSLFAFGLLFQKSLASAICGRLLQLARSATGPFYEGGPIDRGRYQCRSSFWADRFFPLTFSSKIPREHWAPSGLLRSSKRLYGPPTYNLLMLSAAVQAVQRSSAGRLRWEDKTCDTFALIPRQRDRVRSLRDRRGE